MVTPKVSFEGGNVVSISKIKDCFYQTKLSPYSEAGGKGGLEIKIGDQKLSRDIVIEGTAEASDLKSDCEALADILSNNLGDPENSPCKAVVVMPESKINYEPARSYINAILQNEKFHNKRIGIIRNGVPRDATEGVVFDNELDFVDASPDYIPALVDETDENFVLRGYGGYDCPNCGNSLTYKWGKKHLFSLKTADSFSKKLERGSIPEKLEKKFKDEGYSLSKSASIAREGECWKISSEGKYYSINNDEITDIIHIFDQEKKGFNLFCDTCGLTLPNLSCTLDFMSHPSRPPEILIISADFLEHILTNEKSSYVYN